MIPRVSLGGATHTLTWAIATVMVSIGASLADPVDTGAAPPPVRRACPMNEYYPPAAIAACIEGTTAVHFKIGVDGETSNIRVYQSSGNDELDEAAIACVAKWHYKPATYNGVPIEVAWRAQIRWHLDNCKPAN